MLHCNMNASTMPLQVGLEDLLADLAHARRTGDLGRLAWLAYCEIRRWARAAGEQELARHSSELIVNSPHANRTEFIAQIDSLIAELEQARARIPGPRSRPGGMAASGRG
jgi:hypothetical protein